MKIRLIHGIRSKEGDNDMSHFAPHIQRAMPDGLVMLWQYGFVDFWQARWENNGIAYDFAAESRLGRQKGEFEVWITHSNGAAVAYLAVEKHGANPDMIININPALDRWRTASVPYVETIYSDCDRWVWLSQWLPFNLWGDQGKVGYRGRLSNTLNHDASGFPEPMAYKDHTGAFEPDRIAHWAEFCAHRIELASQVHAMRNPLRRSADFQPQGAAA